MLVGLRARAIALVLGCVGCQPHDDFPTAKEAEQLTAILGSPLAGADPTNAIISDPRAVALGRRLFVDPDFSRCGWVTCQSCHDPAAGYGGADPSQRGCSQSTFRRAPSLVGAGNRAWFGWDGHKDSTWSQAQDPLLTAGEIGSSMTIVRQVLGTRYASDFASLFGYDVSTDTDDRRVLSAYGKALGAYVASLQWAGPSSFDAALARYLEAVKQGRAAADPLHAGLKTFVRAGCIRCHSGPSLSDEQFHNVGLFDAGDVPASRGGRAVGFAEAAADPMNGASLYSDDVSTGAAKLEAARASGAAHALGAFRTPSLRGVAHLRAFFHRGSVTSLRDVIDFFDRGGDPDGSFLGRRDPAMTSLALSDPEKQALVHLLDLMDDSVQ